MGRRVTCYYTQKLGTMQQLLPLEIYSEPWFQQADRGPQRASARYEKPMFVKDSQRRFITKDPIRHKIKKDIVRPCIAAPIPLPIISTITCLLCGHGCSEKMYIMVRIGPER